MLRMIGARTREVLVEAIDEALDAVSARDAEGRLLHSLRLPWAGAIVVKFAVGKQVKKVKSFIKTRWQQQQSLEYH